MGVIRKLFLFAVFVGSTYCWLVLFEFGPSGFGEGLTTYYHKFMPEEEKAAPQQLPQAPPPRKPAGPPVIGGGGTK